MVSAGEVKVNITGDMRDLQIALRQAGQQVDSTAARMERVMGRAFGVMRTGAIAAGAAMAAGIAMAIRESANAEEIRSRFDAVFRDLAGSTREWVEETADAVSRSSIDLEQYMSTFQDTFVPLGASREDAAALSQQLTTLAIDLASFNNENDPDAVRALQSAIVGNHETVRRYGVIINQTRLEQELLNMGILGGRDAATELQTAQARLNIIMAGTTDAQGDGIRTADSLTNQYKSFAGEVRDVAVAIGDEFQPVASAMLTWAEEMLPAIEAAGTALGRFMTRFSNLMGGRTIFDTSSREGLEAYREELLELQEMFGDEMVRRRGFGAPEYSVSTDTRENESAQTRLRNALGASRMEAAGLGAELNNTRYSLEELDAIASLLSESLGETNDSIKTMTESSSDNNDELGETFTRMEHIYNMPPPPPIADPVEDFVQAWRDAEAAMEAVSGTEMPAVTEAVEEMRNALEDISEGAMKNLENAFVDFVRTGRLEIGNLVDYIIEQFARLAFQEWFAPQIQGGLESIIGGIGSVLGLGSAGAGGVTAGGKSGLAGAAQIINIDARYATEGTAAMIEKAFQTQGPQIVNTSVQASVQMVAGMNEAVSVT